MKGRTSTGRTHTRQFPKRLVVAAFLMVVFGLAEIVTSFTHRFFGLPTDQLTMSTVVGATIGTFYFLSGFLVLSKKKIAATIAIVLLIADALGRISMVITGLYPIDSGVQIVAIITGTSIVIFFAFYIGLQRRYFK